MFKLFSQLDRSKLYNLKLEDYLKKNKVEESDDSLLETWSCDSTTEDEKVPEVIDLTAEDVPPAKTGLSLEKIDKLKTLLVKIDNLIQEIDTPEDLPKEEKIKLNWENVSEEVPKKTNFFVRTNVQLSEEKNLENLEKNRILVDMGMKPIFPTNKKTSRKRKRNSNEGNSEKDLQRIDNFERFAKKFAYETCSTYDPDFELSDENFNN